MLVCEGISGFFYKPYCVKSWGFFACCSVHQDASFEVSKTVFWQFFRFFTMRGDPWDLGRPKNWQHTQKLQKKKKIRMDQESRWYSMFKRLNKNFMKIRIILPWYQAGLILSSLSAFLSSFCCGPDLASSSSSFVYAF